VDKDFGENWGSDRPDKAMIFTEGDFHVISATHFIHHAMTMTLRNTKRRKKCTNSGTNFSVRKMKGQCSPNCDQQNEISKKGESASSTLIHSFFLPRDLLGDVT
jgi:hypothetical protein